MWYFRIQRLIALIGFVLLTAAACAQSTKDLDPMTEDQIEKLSRLSGAQYEQARNAFLASAAALPTYADSLSDRDPRYRAQYLILRGWQNNPKIAGEIEKEIADVDGPLVGARASGFDSVHNFFFMRMDEWEGDGLPFFWETILKFEHESPDWVTTNALKMIASEPSEDSIDPILISMHTKTDRSEYASRFQVLLQMPKAGLRERLEEDGAFYTSVRPIIEKALAERR